MDETLGGTHDPDPDREEARLLAIASDHAPDGLFVVGVEPGGGLRLLAANRAFLGLVGRARDRAVGLPIGEVVPAGDRGPIVARIAEAIEARRPSAFVESAEFPDGRRHVEVALTPIVGDGGAVAHVAGSIRDVTGRVESDRAACDREDWNRRAQVVGGVGTFDHDIGRDVCTGSEVVLSLFEVPAGETAFDAARWERLVHPDDRARVARELAECLASTTSDRFEGEYRIVGSTGEVRWVAYASQVARDASGGPSRLVGTIREITDRKRAEAAIARDALLLANVRDSVIVTDLDGIVTYWNAGATRIFGWTADEMIGRPMVDRFPAPEVRDWVAANIRAFAGGTEWIGEWEDYRKDGSRVWIDARTGAVHDTEGRPVAILGLAQEITDRKQAELELKEADRKKDEFLALLAHELRNPLAPIRNGLELLRIDGDDPQTLDMMARQLAQMVRLIDDLLDVSRIGRNKLELRRSRVAAADVVRLAVETARPAIAEAGHRLEVALPERPIALDADLARLAQVVANLLVNSAKYTEPGGLIRLEVRDDRDDVAIAVVDTGIGIPAESLPTVFDMFSQVDRSIERSTGGLGIGLALVRALVEMHGGSVVAESDGPGKGSRFTVRIPGLGPVEAPESPPPIEPERSGLAPRRRVLIADDNRESAATMARLIGRLGHEVMAVGDGVEAVDAFESFAPDLILMDLGMPRLNGYDATRRIRSLPGGRDVAIAAMSGWGREADRLRSSEAGCDEHLVKPVDFDSLLRLLDRAPSA